MKLKFTYCIFLFCILVSIKSYSQQISNFSKDKDIQKKDKDSIFIKKDIDSIIFPKIYWNLNDKNKYKVLTKETKILKDSTIVDKYSYTIYAEVKNIHQNEVTVNWVYRDLHFDSESFYKNPIALVNGISVTFKIDQDGKFIDYIDLDKTIKSLIVSSENLENKYLDQPENIALIKKNVELYASKENIIKLFEKDINQFHHFYGKSKFTIEGKPFVYKSYMTNLFSKSPTPATTTMKLNEISLSNTNYVLESLQESDKDWLANSWFTYLKNLATKLETEQPSEDRLKDDIEYYVKITSRIKDNGWISYSIETKKVKFQDTDYTLERRFELVNN